ncbi:FadR family transcriptional regulator [bacterium]|nr:FadR family transcriptional regulator [bacterium]
MIGAGVWPQEKIFLNEGEALYVSIFDRIREWLRTGRLAEGEPLPSERELARMFGVSRVPVREALRVLEFFGIVQHVRGKGLLVRKVSANDIIETVDFVMMNPAYTIRELFEVRMGMETQAACLAARRRDSDDLEAMKAALERSSRQPLAVEPFLGFHSALIAASHNTALVEINSFLSDWLRHLRAKYMYSPVGGERGIADHRELFRAIEARDCPGAMACMQAHLLRAKAMIARVEAGREGGIALAGSLQ